MDISVKDIFDVNKRKHLYAEKHNLKRTLVNERENDAKLYFYFLAHLSAVNWFGECFKTIMLPTFKDSTRRVDLDMSRSVTALRDFEESLIPTQQSVTAGIPRFEIYNTRYAPITYSIFRFMDYLNIEGNRIAAVLAVKFHGLLETLERRNHPIMRLQTNMQVQQQLHRIVLRNATQLATLSVPLYCQTDESKKFDEIFLDNFAYLFRNIPQAATNITPQESLVNMRNVRRAALLELARERWKRGMDIPNDMAQQFQNELIAGHDTSKKAKTQGNLKHDIAREELDLNMAYWRNPYSRDTPYTIFVASIV